MTALYLRVNWQMLPAEDALMLMRYATHLSAGHGIVWNIGDRPVEGATDFLYLVLLSGWMKVTQLGAISAARTFLAISHLLGTLLLYVSARRVAGAGRLLAFLLAAYFGLGSGLIHVGNGFSGPFYALMALIAWSFASFVVLRGGSTACNVGFAFFALMAGLTRPDGVFLAILMTLALLYALGRKSTPIVLTTVAFFVVLGGAYFAWRFHYFGYLLPNPFYKKGGGHLYPASLKTSIENVLHMLMPVSPIFLAGLIFPRSRRLTIFSLIPIVGFALIWVLLTNENNAANRFQYAVVPIGLLSAGFIVQALLGQMRVLGWLRADEPISMPAMTQVFAAAVCCILFGFYWKALFPGQQVIGTGPYHIAKALSRFADKKYTIVATEAGVIPYFSGWRAIDAWGLNDSEIVHNPRGLTAAYLDQSKPAIISMYISTDFGMDDLSRTWYGQAPPAENIHYLVEEASYYAKSHGYILAARWGVVACAVNIWYVRADLPETAELVRIIRQEPHFYPYDPEFLSTNYLDQAPPAVCGESLSVIHWKE